MFYKEYIPPPALQADIKCFWALETNADEGEQRILPDGCAELVLYCSTNRFTSYSATDTGTTSHKGALIGQVTKHILLKNTQPVAMVGIRFYPWGLNNYLKVPVRETTDQSLFVGDIFGKDGIELQEKILETREMDTAVLLMRQFLFTKRQDDASPFINTVVKEIISNNGCLKIKDIATHYKYSERYVEKGFMNKIGISPKLFSRIIRLQHTVRLLNKTNIEKLTYLAYQTDFFDQSHFIRDFKELAGLSPKAYLTENHLLSDCLTA